MRFFALLLLALSFPAVSFAGDPPKSHEATPAASKIKYEFELDAAGKAKLFEGLKSLKSGDSIERAKSALGKPDEEYDPTSGHGFFAQFIDDYIGAQGRAHILHYYIKRVNLKDANMNDQLIQLTFDMAGNLQYVGYASLQPVTGTVINHYKDPTSEYEQYIAKLPMPESKSKVQ